MQPTSVQGQRLGRYELRSVLGEGGHGVVYEAILHGVAGFRKPVALKVLSPRAEPRDAQARAALQREARLGAMLSHPHLVSILDLGSSGDQWYVAMELVVGTTVSALSKAGLLTPAMVLDIGLMVGSGLAHLHGHRIEGATQGLVHRDIKPQNLLVDETGVVKIADFGIAGLTSEGGAAGTPTWMAPEHHRGAAEPRSDLFSLGAVLFALLTRRAPFGTGARARAEVERCEQSLRDPAFLSPTEALVPGIGEVLRRCLRHDPADRWPDASALVAALRVLRPAHGPPALAEAVANGRGTTAPGSGTSASSSAGRPRLPEVDPLFVGRAEERKGLGALWREHRALTLVGPGGVGKTRLAIELSAGQPDPVWFVDGSAAKTQGDLARALGARLGLPSLERDEVAQVGAALASRGRARVVLDGVEACAEPAAAAVRAWLEAAPEARFLVTSRVPLRHPSERICPVEPLPVADAVRLFHARCVVPVEAGEASEVEPLVRSLDCLPLAIELAAARSRAMTPGMLRQRMSERFRLLADPKRGGPSRHATLKASIQVSWDLLQPWERAALTQVAVFEGGWTLEAAEAVLDLSAWPEAPWAVDVGSALADASLLHVDPSTQRFHLSNSVRDFLLEVGERATLQGAEVRHGRWYAQLGTGDASDRARFHGGERLRDSMVAERDNVVAACERALARSDAAVASGCAVVLGTLAVDLGPISPGEALLARVLALDGLPDRGRLLLLRSSMTAELGRRAESLACLEEARELARRTGQSPVELFARALLLRRDPRPAVVQELGEICEEARSRGDASTEARVRTILGFRLQGHGRRREAMAEQERSLALFEQLGDARGMGLCLLRIASLHAESHRHQESLAHLERAERWFVLARDAHNADITRENIAIAHYYGGRRDLCRELFQDLAERARRAGRSLAEANVRRNLAELDREQGRLEEARVQLRRVFHLLRDPTEPEARLTHAHALDEAAALASLDGDLERELEHRRQALASWRESARPSEIALAELRLALADADALGPDALRALEGGPLGRTVAIHLVLGCLLLAAVALRRGEVAWAGRLAARARGARPDRGEDRLLEARIRILEARLLAAGGRPAQALEHLRGIEADIGEERLRASMWMARAEGLLAGGDAALAGVACSGAAEALVKAGAAPTSTDAREFAALQARVEAALGEAGGQG